MIKKNAVGLWLHENKDRELRMATRVAGLLQEQGMMCLGIRGQRTADVNGVQALPLTELAKKASCMLVLGGDGTMLAAARACAPYGLPLLGINLGRRGFLAEVECPDVEDALRRLACGEGQVEERMMLQADILQGETVVGSYIALNDVTLTREEPVKMIRLDVRLDGAFVERYQADAVLVATPTGSTAYSLSAGGPLLTPDADALILNPVCAHSFSSRPIVARGQAVVRFDPLPASPHVLVTMDGQERIPLREGQWVRVQKSPAVTRLIRLHGRNVFAVLRRKFMNLTDLE